MFNIQTAATTTNLLETNIDESEDLFMSYWCVVYSFKNRIEVVWTSETLNVSQDERIKSVTPRIGMCWCDSDQKEHLQL